MNIDKLKAFVVVAEAGSFRKASQSLHRTQPAITKSIQSLEAELGLTLFTRDSYRPSLTPAGEKLLPRAKTIINNVSNFKAYSNLLNSNVENQLRLAIDVLYPIEEISETLNNLMTQYPTTNFYIFSETLGGAVERLIDGDVDIAIAEKLGDTTNIDAKKLCKIPLIAVTTPQYHQKHLDDFLSPETLENTLQIILTDSSKHLPKYTFGVVEGSNAWIVTDLQTKKNLIQSGLGWGRLPDYLVQNEIDSGKLIKLNYPHIQHKTVTLSIMRKKDDEHGPIAQQFWKM